MNKFERSVLAARVVLLVILRIAKTLLVTFIIKFLIKKIYLKGWFGELGNNLIQIVHGIFISEKLNIPIYTPQHPLLKLEDRFPIHKISIIETFDISSLTSALLLNDLTCKIEGDKKLGFSLFRSFFYQYDFFPIAPRLRDYREILNRKVFPLIPQQEDETINEDTLVIHLRSGDAFNTYPHNAYVQPPLSFYIEVIERFDFQDIVIVTQPDFRNPCVNQLTTLYPQIRVQASSLQEDISTILSARNLITSFSTFSLMLGLASNRIKKLFVPQFEVATQYWRVVLWPPILRLMTISSPLAQTAGDLDFQMYFIKVSNYIAIGEWKNSQKQRDLMLNHACKPLNFS